MVISAGEGVGREEPCTVGGSVNYHCVNQYKGFPENKTRTTIRLSYANPGHEAK